MRVLIKTTTVVQFGGKVEIIAPELQQGESVEVILLSQTPDKLEKRSVVDILNDAPGHRLFHSEKEVDQYIRQERDSWDS